MNLFELSWGLSCAVGLVSGAVSGAKAGAVGLLIGAPVGLAVGAGCYFGMMGLSALAMKVTYKAETEESTWVQDCAAGFCFAATGLAPILSGVLAAMAAKALLL